MLLADALPDTLWHKHILIHKQSKWEPALQPKKKHNSCAAKHGAHKLYRQKSPQSFRGRESSLRKAFRQRASSSRLIGSCWPVSFRVQTTEKDKHSPDRSSALLFSRHFKLVAENCGPSFSHRLKASELDVTRPLPLQGVYTHHDLKRC